MAVFPTTTNLFWSSVVVVALLELCTAADSCNFTADSTDPLKGPIRAGNDLKCSPIADDSLAGCVAACCDTDNCESISWNAPWTLGDHVYMDCEQGKNCCCLKSAVPPLEPNKCVTF